ncbi:MAG: hypothetical protein AB1401_04235 [Thermodesulfobacteriota bacterium]
MSALTLIISIIALVLAIVSFKRTGGLQDIKGQINNLESIMGPLREKTANVLGKMEKALRNPEKEEEPEKKEDDAGEGRE